MNRMQSVAKLLGKRRLKETLICSHRYINQNVNEDKYLKFIKQIENEFSNGECLNYLNDLFKQFQNMVSVQIFDNSVLNTHWDGLLNVERVDKIRKSLEYVNNHKNFNNLKLYLNENLNSYSPKEIAIISKMYKTIEINHSDNHSAKLINNLNEYCMKNVENFDLSDLENASYCDSVTFNNAEFLRSSSNRIMKELTNNESKVEYNGIVLDHLGSFESHMRNLDEKNHHFWLKLKLFKKYHNLLEAVWCVKTIEDIFRASNNNFASIDSLQYKVNFIVKLLNCCNYYPKEVLKLNIFELIQKSDFNSLFSNLDLMTPALLSMFLLARRMS